MLCGGIGRGVESSGCIGLGGGLGYRDGWVWKSKLWRCVIGIVFGRNNVCCFVSFWIKVGRYGGWCVGWFK